MACDADAARPATGLVDGAAIAALYRQESRRVLATLIRLLGDFDLAEEALQEAFRAALEQWPREGLPAHPRAWLVSTGRFRAIDALRRRARFEPLDDHAQRVESLAAPAPPEPEALEDDRLRLVFTCCHPALGPDAQVALTLREVCGLTTEAIASAFLVPAPTVAQRIVRAKAKIRAARIPYQVPEPAQWPERLASVLRVIYLVFNEGYAASEGGPMLRAELSTEALRLGRLLVELLPAYEPEAHGLLALMLLHEARRTTRVDAQGALVLLEDQDRSRWDQALIAEGITRVSAALRARRSPHEQRPYALQAAIAAVHAESPSSAQTDWPQIVALYTLLLQVDPSPVVALNRAVAVAMRDGPQAGLKLIDDLLAQGDLVGYALAHAARGELLRRMGRATEALAAFHEALLHTPRSGEEHFLRARMAQCQGLLPGPTAA